MSERSFKIQYHGSLPWLIFWIIVFFPIALTLFFTDVTYDIDQKSYYLKYDGSIFWLCFWVLVFFPIAFVLFFLNGFSIRTISKYDEFDK